MSFAKAVPHRRVVAAVALIGASAVEIIAMALHPTAHGSSPQAWMTDLATISPLNTHVHMIMIAAVLVVWLALGWCLRQRPLSGWSWVAERLYGLGALAVIGAALINGFAVGHYAHRVMEMDGIEASSAVSTVMLAFSLNRTLAGFGTLMLSCGVIAWSIALWRDASRLGRVAGTYGMLAGTACCVAYAGGWLRLDVQGMAAVVIAHAVWYALVGAVVLRSD